jgi:hypothetical protein
VVGCVTSAASGARCSEGFLSAAFSKAATVSELTPKGGAGLVVSAAVGGTAAALGGGNFANGAVTAAFGYMFNQLSENSARALREGAVGKLWDEATAGLSTPPPEVVAKAAAPIELTVVRGLFPATTAPLVREHIGGSFESQLYWAENVAVLRVESVNAATYFGGLRKGGGDIIIPYVIRKGAGLMFPVDRAPPLVNPAPRTSYPRCGSGGHC